jgi:hypothetical protein
MSLIDAITTDLGTFAVAVATCLCASAASVAACRLAFSEKLIALPP